MKDTKLKVIVSKILSSDGSVSHSESWFKVGEIYHVLAINICQNGWRTYVLDDSLRRKNYWPTFASHRAECFNILSTKIPSNWQFWIDPSGECGVSPKSWQDGGVSEALHDHNELFRELFEKETALIYTEDP